MQVLKGDYREEDLPFSSPVMTLGNFDGVHRGHQFLIDHVRGGADQLGKQAVVLTFSPHPSHVIGESAPASLLFSQEDQNEMIAARRIDFLVIQEFDSSFAQIEAQDFLRQYFFPKFNPEKVILGHDFRFGNEQKGDFDLFVRIAKEFHCLVEKVEPFSVKKEVVSSSRIRDLIGKGEVQRGMEYLGRPYYIESEVIKGEQLGRKIGFPTANLRGPFAVLPKSGVFLGRAQFKGMALWAVLNIGVRPTVTEKGELTVECHILDFIGDIYGQNLKFEFYYHIRDEMKFSSLDELKMQIDRDVRFARLWVERHGKTN